jgi:Cytochrome C'
MAKALNAEQSEALEAVLPARFKQLDAEFHARAGALAEAAGARDPELASYHFSRLVEGCAGCHALYAKARFPGFGPAAEPGHHH